MKKASTQIEGDVFALIRVSELPGFITGKLYRGRNKRKVGEMSEDAVLAFVSGINEQVQEGILNLNVYVSNIDNGSGVLVENESRTEEIAAMIIRVIDSMHTPEYEMRIKNIVQSYPIEGVEQHVVNAKIEFKRLAI